MKYFYKKYHTSKFLLLRALCLCVIMAVSGLGFSADVTVTVDGNIGHQMMDGFGSTIRTFDDPHVFNNFNGETLRANTTMTPDQEDVILDLLYVDLGLTRVRPATDRDPGGNSIEPQNDNNDPNETDLSKFNFAWKNNDAFIDLVKRLQSRGVTNYFLSPIELESWMTEANPEEYVEWAMAIIRRWRDQGVELPFYSIMNEPGYERGGYWSGTYLRDVIKLLGSKLAAEGFATKIIAPDDLHARVARERLDVIMADPDAAKYVGAFGYHLYGDWPEDKQLIKTMSLQNDIPIWMTEWSPPPGYSTSAASEAWVDALHDQISENNVSAVDHMWGFFGEWEPTNTHFISLLYSDATYTGYRLNKNYYLTGQYSRYVRPGFRRVDVESSSSLIRCTAYTQASDFVQVCANRGDSTLSIQVNLAGINSFTELQAVRTSYTGTENWAELSSVAVSDSSFSIVLPAGSVTTYFYKGETTSSPETTLSLALAQPSISENGGINTLTVSRIGSTESMLLVNLSSSDTSEATLPTTISIPAGSSSSMVSVSAVDDLLNDSDQSVTLTASIENTIATIGLMVLDDEVSVSPVELDLQLTQVSISENGGASTLTISRTGSITNELVIALSSNDATEAALPALVTIPAGSASKTVIVSALNDAMVDGDQSVTLTVNAVNASEASINITVRDDDTNTSQLTLALSLDTSSIIEEDGVSLLTVSRTGSITNDLMVTFSSSDITEATLPASVTIRAGNASETVVVSAMDDAAIDGDQSVTLTANAGNVTVSIGLTVRDDDEGGAPTDTNAPELIDRTWTIHGTTGKNTITISIGDLEAVPLDGEWSLTLPLLDGRNTYAVITTMVIEGETKTATRNIVVVGPVEQATN